MYFAIKHMMTKPNPPSEQSTHFGTLQRFAQHLLAESFDLLELHLMHYFTTNVKSKFDFKIEKKKKKYLEKFTKVRKCNRKCSQ